MDDIDAIIGGAWRAAAAHRPPVNPEGDRIRAEAEAELLSGRVTVNGKTFRVERDDAKIRFGPWSFRVGFA